MLQTVTGRRSRIVVDHILEHGYITTEQLEEEYGYKHPPRAVADVRDQGVPIETFQTTASSGQAIAGYRFGNPSDAIVGQTGGRRNFPQKLKLIFTRFKTECARYANKNTTNGIFKLTIAFLTVWQGSTMMSLTCTTTYCFVAPAIAPNRGHANIVLMVASPKASILA